MLIGLVYCKFNNCKVVNEFLMDWKKCEYLLMMGVLEKFNKFLWGLIYY